MKFCPRLTLVGQPLNLEPQLSLARQAFLQMTLSSVSMPGAPLHTKSQKFAQGRVSHMAQMNQVEAVRLEYRHHQLIVLSPH
jgi:hypothetical protein